MLQLNYCICIQITGFTPEVPWRVISQELRTQESDVEMLSNVFRVA